MHGERDLEQLIAEIEREFPRFRIVEKRGDALSRAIDLALKLLTLGGQSRYLTHYYTVLGDTLYVPHGWKDSPPVRRMITLRHERVHLRQRRRWTLPGMAALYLFPILPLGLALGRARIEWEAYRETLQATFELEGRAALFDPRLREHVVSQFLGPSYGWMWPFRGQVERWYDDAIAAIAGDQPKST